MITDIILLADNVSNWSRPKTASEGHVNNGELTCNNTSTKHQPHSPLHRNKERLKDTEVRKHIYIMFFLTSFTFYKAAATVDFILFCFTFYFIFYLILLIFYFIILFYTILYI